jgi:hypothetical protein
MASIKLKVLHYASLNEVSSVDFLQDVLLQDDSDGNGVYIKEWNLDIPQPTLQQLDQYNDIVDFNHALSNLRAKRDALLNETDYIVIKAKETGATIPTAWKTYRQALRDITEGLTTVEEVEAVVFPQKP